jgi:hypothetical protein
MFLITKKAPNSDLVILKSTNLIFQLFDRLSIKATRNFKDIVICHHILIFYKVRLKCKAGYFRFRIVKIVITLIKVTAENPYLHPPSRLFRQIKQFFLVHYNYRYGD